LWDKDQLSAFSSVALHAGDGIVALNTARSGTLWITTHSGAFSLNAGQVEPFPTDKLPQERGAGRIGVYEDHSGNLWVFGATFVLNLTQDRRLNSPSMELASSREWKICEQPDGTLWIGSGSGLFRFQDHRFEITGVREGLARLRRRRLDSIGVNEEFGAYQPSALAPDSKGSLWIGTADYGLWRWDSSGLKPFADGPPLDRVTQIQTLCLDREGALWVGTRGEGLIEYAGGRQQHFTTTDGLSDDVVPAVAADPMGDGVWAGTRVGNLHHVHRGTVDTLTKSDGLTGRAILCLLADRRGNLLIGSEGGGLLIWNGRHLVPFPGPEEMAQNAVSCLFEGIKGRLWVGTYGGGAFCYSGEKWVPLTIRQGLGSDTVGQIAEDTEGNLWLDTDQGLFNIHAAEAEAFLKGTYGTVSCVPVLAERRVGDPQGPVGWPCVARAKDGIVWMATRAGVVALNSPHSLLTEMPPPVFLEEVMVNGQPTDFEARTPLRFGPRTQSLDFFFTAVNFIDPKEVRFRYKVENYDSDWVQNGDVRHAHYGSVPAGRYQFRVQASNADGVWNDTEASLAFVVIPPFWRTFWFLTSAVVLVIASIWASARFISTRRLQACLRAAEHQQAMYRERARIAQDMHDEIGSKLTRISFLSEVARAGAGTAHAAQPIEAIANTSRSLLQALDEIVWAVNPRNDTLEYLAGYLEQHAREYFRATSVECTLQMPAQIPAASLSSEVRHNVFLAFEEALNNALKHARATRVQIIMRPGPETFEVRIQDNGQGFGPSESLPEQDGLLNMRQRLHSVGGECEVASQLGKGTAITLRFPVGVAVRPHVLRS
jgi:signal transduction histidine kinase